MESIKELILKRKEYGINLEPQIDDSGDRWLNQILANAPGSLKAKPKTTKEKKEQRRLKQELSLNIDSSDVAIVLTANDLLDRSKIRKIQRKDFRIAGVYKIGNVYSNLPIPFYIIHFTKRTSVHLKVALFDGVCFDAKYRIPFKPHLTGMNVDLVIPDTYTDEWEKYVSLLEGWMNGGEIPADGHNYEFHIVNDLYKESLLPETYSKENIQIRKYLGEIDTAPLSEIAYILKPKTEKGSINTVKVLNSTDMSNRIDAEDYVDGSPTNVILKKGDVLFSVLDKALDDNDKPVALFDYEGEEPIYASPFIWVIRCENVPPEYLYLYLISETAVKVFNAEFAGRNALSITSKELADLPVPIPNLDDEHYIKEFNLLTKSRARSYNQLKSLREYFDKIIAGPKGIEDMLNLELANIISIYRENELRTFLSDDLKELDTCFKYKAYKATLILAGSILEAVLIDWLSEMEGENYFENQLKVPDRYNPGKSVNATLADYIDRIKYIKHPEWVEEADKATRIKDNRNLVHAKLCLETNAVIDEELCKRVISYLNDVLESRGSVLH